MYIFEKPYIVTLFRWIQHIFLITSLSLLFTVVKAIGALIIFDCIESDVVRLMPRYSKSVKNLNIYIYTAYTATRDTIKQVGQVQVTGHTKR